MMICRRCDFVFNAAFDAGKLQYGEGYENDQSASPTFDAHVEELVRILVEEKGIRDANIVEVGCGNGNFLRRLVGPYRNRGIGFDPSYRGPDVAFDGRLSFIRRFYSAESTTMVPDVVISRHVIEHVADPATLVSGIREAIGETAGVQLFLETPCVEWILRNEVIWDFFYEHCSLFTARSLATLVRRGGFVVQSVQHVFGGQYLWLHASSGTGADVHPEEDVIEAARAFRSRESEDVRMWRERITQLAVKNKVAIWGAGAKGVTLAGLLDPERELVECLIDINPQKQGKFAPGTGHPIVDFRVAADRGVEKAILMNPNYRDETAHMLRQADVAIDLVI